jgi:hypothetical protein
MPVLRGLFHLRLGHSRRFRTERSVKTTLRVVENPWTLFSIGFEQISALFAASDASDREPSVSEGTRSAGRGHLKNRGQPREPKCREATCESKERRALWGNDARRDGVPTPSHTRPQAVSSAWWLEHRRTTRSQKRKFSQWRLDSRSRRGAPMASVARS